MDWRLEDKFLLKLFISDRFVEVDVNFLTFGIETCYTETVIAEQLIDFKVWVKLFFTFFMCKSDEKISAEFDIFNQSSLHHFSQINLIDLVFIMYGKVNNLVHHCGVDGV